MGCSGCSKKKGIARVIEKVSHIATGFTHLIFTDPEIELFAKERYAICFSCGEKDIIAYKKIKNEVVMKCNKCKCYISAKIRVKEEVCPLNKW